MWGGHGEQSASTQREHHASAQKSGSASTHTKQQDNSNKAKNDGNVKDESKNTKNSRLLKTLHNIMSPHNRMNSICRNTGVIVLSHKSMAIR